MYRRLQLLKRSAGYILFGFFIHVRRYLHALLRLVLLLGEAPTSRLLATESVDDSARGGRAPWRRRPRPCRVRSVTFPLAVVKRKRRVLLRPDVEVTS